MATRWSAPRFLLLVFVLGSLIPLRVSAQVNQAPARITQAVNETRLTVLRGNTHPLARPQFDRGPAPATLPMDRMLLVLKRSPEQEAALEKFMAEQQDPSSRNFHKWLTPQEFGQRFGPADQDIQTIKSWLESRGFQVGNVSKGRTVIEFSGTAGEVRETFHTTIHKYVLPNGEQHWANASDPAIPVALAPVVVGVNTLHNFFPKPMSHVVSASARYAEATSPRPLFTFPAGCSGTNCNFVVGPADFATIYNVTPLWDAGIDGTGQTIAIVSDSNINIQDVRDFRSIFGLPAKDPNIIVNGGNPGLTNDEIEAIIDVEWSGAVARNAEIDLVVSATSNTSFGGDLSATYVVNNNLAPILSMSFGQCELFLGTAQNAFYNSTWQQARTEGITVVVSSGDDGSAGCDFVQGNTPAAQPATSGLAVNGLASTPHNVAVGGTEFNYSVANPLQFWSTSNNPYTEASALSYIPEATYNDSCTNAVVYTYFGFSSAEAACNDPTVQQFQNSSGVHLVGPVGGSGGASNCITSDGFQLSSCGGGYAKPSWQNALTPADNSRDLPDISLFAGDGTISGSAYVVCNRDYPGVNNAPCSLTNGTFLYAGGTSISAQVFAGIMALLDQKYESRQGLINPLLYDLAATSGNSCTSSTNPPAACIFYDTTSGTISMPCKVGTPDCLPPANSSNMVSVLSGFDAGTGYDLATGLGSVNAANLVSAAGWTSTTGGDDFTLSLSSPTVTVSRGGSGTVTLTITGNNGYAGTIDFTSASCSSLPSGATCSFSPASVTGSGSTTVTISTTAPSMLAPLSGPNDIELPALGAALTLVGTLSISLLLLRLCYTRRRWSTAGALVAFSLAFAIVGCGGGAANNGGGGGGGSGGSGTPLGTSTFVITAKTTGASTIQRSVSVTLTVN
jgi:subtilase family serine protease